LRLILTNANVIDCVNLDPKTLATVIIEDGRILETRDGVPPTNNSEDRVIDLAGPT